MPDARFATLDTQAYRSTAAPVQGKFLYVLPNTVRERPPTHDEMAELRKMAEARAVARAESASGQQA